MPLHSTVDVERITIRGGPVNGAVLEMPAEVAAELDAFKLTINQDGEVFELRHGQRRILRSVRVVELPVAQRPVKKVTVLPPVEAPKKRRRRKPVAAVSFSGKA